MDLDQLFTSVRAALERCGQMLDTLAFAPLTLSAQEKEQTAQTLLGLSERLALQSGLALQEVAETGVAGAEPVLAVLRAHAALADNLLPGLWDAIQKSAIVDDFGVARMEAYA